MDNGPSCALSTAGDEDHDTSSNVWDAGSRLHDRIPSLEAVGVTRTYLRDSRTSACVRPLKLQGTNELRQKLGEELALTCSCQGRVLLEHADPVLACHQTTVAGHRAII